MKFIETSNAPNAVGPYSQAVVCNGLLFTSGQIAIDPMSNKIVEGGIKQQTKQVLQNLKAVLQEASLLKIDVIKTMVFLKKMKDYPQVNELYADFFGDHKPARSCVEVSRLPKNVMIEIELIATINNE